MKELEKQTPIEQHQEVQQEQKYRLLGDLNYHPGLTLYEFDPVTRSLRRADVQAPPSTAVFPVKPPAPKEKIPKGHVMNPEYLLMQHAENRKRTKGTVMYKSGCDYFFALNDKTAAKKLDKMIRRGLIVPITYTKVD